MYSSSSYTRSLPLPRSSSYVSATSRFSGVNSTLPPVSSRYIPSSRYSSLSTISSRPPLSNVSLNRPSTVSTTSYVPSYTGSTASSSLDYQKWRPSTYTPSVTRDRSYLTRRPSFGTSLTSRYGSTSSLASTSSSTSTENEWKPRTSRIGSVHTLPPSQSSFTSHLTSSTSGDENKLAGRVGLHNLGNTCFMNAVLQCLCHTRPLVEYCNHGYFSPEINSKSPTSGDLIKAFASLLKVMWKDSTNNAVSPDHVKRELQKYAPRFGGYNQQDAQELLRYLLQGLHDDINRVRSKSQFHSSTNEYSTESQHAADSWRRYLSTDDSKIVDLFGGQLKSTLKCTECDYTSVTFDPFWDLSLPIPEGSQRITLQQCFRLFTSPEVLDGHEKPVCERCKKKTKSTKQFEINKFPIILVIHLKRFSSGCNYRNKLNVTVDCSPKNVDLSSFSSSNCSNSSSSYNLYGVVDHYGTSASGHYTAKCKNPYNSEWNEFNDSRVLSSSTSDLITERAYLLFYEQGRHCSRL